MWLKKAAALGMTGMLVSAAFVMPVSAHGHHGRQAAGCGYDHDHLCEVCTVEDCARVGWHVHDGSTFCGYDHVDGYCDGTCDAVRVCAVEDCTVTGHHVHDGNSYCGYDHAGGFCDGTCDSIEVCAVEGCTKTGRHTHDGETYCGYGHSSGYCDNSCVQPKRSSVRGGCRGHRGHH
ncbi:MAG: hypothetical protein K2P41_05375 [Lachnospiraceae bacterium]|nr:hypothetical protein [Lachnospiraceae bacterium]